MGTVGLCGYSCSYISGGEQGILSDRKVMGRCKNKEVWFGIIIILIQYYKRYGWSTG